MNDTFHYIQLQILAVLAYEENALFGRFIEELGCTSEILSYHLKVLQTQKLIEKKNESYYLTPDGIKLVANLPLNLEGKFKPTFLSYICIVLDEKLDKYLVIERKKVPQYGKITFVAGKARNGETSEESVKRILNNEVKIEAKDIEYKFLFKQRIFNNDKKLLKDNTFIVFYCNNFEGVATETEIAKPLWLKLEEIKSLKKKAYDVKDILENIQSKNPSQLLEKDYTLNSY